MRLAVTRGTAAAVVILLALAALVWLVTPMLFRHPVERLTLTPLAGATPIVAESYNGEWGPSPQLVELDGLPPILVVPSSDGSVAAFDISAGRRIWQVALPRADRHDAWMMADPVRVADQLVFAYSWIPHGGGDRSHHAAVIDLRRGVVNAAFPQIEFAARKRAANGSVIAFDPVFQHPRSGLAHVPVKGGYGLVYAAFGAEQDLGIWHGWLFEIDLDAWHRTGGRSGLANVFLTTPVTDCTAERKDCGGGIWAYAGPQVHATNAGYEILVQTGNGRLDLSRDSYAQSLVRLSPGLKFVPGCDSGLCGKGDPKDPSGACLNSCRNLFVPRLMAGDPPLDPADGSCRGVSFLKCLDINDWDFGAGAPTRFEADGHAFYVTASKAGGLYLIDAERLGTLYDRKQAASLCGTVGSPCPTVTEGVAMAQPQIAHVGNRTIAITPTYNLDEENSAGLVAYEIETRPTPKLKEIWRTPAANSAEARTWFRAPPTRLVLSDIGGEPVAWIADNADAGRLLAVRARDGRTLANIRTRGRPMRNVRPVVYENVIYLPTLAADGAGKSRIEAYRFKPS